VFVLLLVKPPLFFFDSRLAWIMLSVITWHRHLLSGTPSMPGFCLVCLPSLFVAFHDRWPYQTEYKLPVLLWLLQVVTRL
jgi:hypothetical protein